MGSRRYGFTHTHPQQQIMMSGSFQPSSLYTLEKKRQCTSDRRLGGPPEAIWTLREEERLLHRPQIELRFVAYPTVSLITIPNELLRIRLSCYYCLYTHRRNLFVNLLTPWCRVLLEQLTGLQLVKKFPAFHGTRMFITALTSVRNLSVSWASPIQSIYSHPTSWRSILILSTHLCLGLPSGLTCL